VKIGVISDTHDFFDPKIPGLFAGVEHILHGGDVGSAFIRFQLEQIAPVAAVLGNTDADASLRLTKIIELAGKKFLIHHIVNPHSLNEDLQKRITRERPDAIIFGHTHKAFNEIIGGALYLNPGYAGKPKSNAERSVAILHCPEMGVEFLAL
jgi:uncharacterized protein